MGFNSSSSVRFMSQNECDWWMNGEPIEMCLVVGPRSLNDAQLHVQVAVGPLLFMLGQYKQWWAQTFFIMLGQRPFLYWKPWYFGTYERIFWVPVTGGSQRTRQRPSPAHATDGPGKPVISRHRPSHPRHRFSLLLRLKLSVRSVPSSDMPIQDTLNSVISRLWQRRVHVILRSLVVLTWTWDRRELV